MEEDALHRAAWLFLEHQSKWNQRLTSSPGPVNAFGRASTGSD